MSATATRSHMNPTSINLPDNLRLAVIDLLSDHLADTLDLKTQAKQAHWNLKGLQFLQLHELFDELASHLEAQSDTIAERITTLGGTAHGTARQVAATSRIPEYDLDAVSCQDHLRALIARLAQHANQCREAIDKSDELKDKATADLFTAIVRETDKDLWFLEAHLQA